MKKEAVHKELAILAGVGVALLTFALYFKTLGPGVLPYESNMPKLADSDMLQMQACVLGMTHPTGYPSWVMLSHLFTYRSATARGASTFPPWSTRLWRCSSSTQRACY